MGGSSLGRIAERIGIGYLEKVESAKQTTIIQGRRHGFWMACCLPTASSHLSHLPVPAQWLALGNGDMPCTEQLLVKSFGDEPIQGWAFHEWSPGGPC